MQRAIPLLLAFALLPAALPAGETLRSIAEIDAFTEDATPRKVPFALTGRVVGAFVLIAFAASFAASILPVISELSGGTRTILLTVVLAAIAAVKYPRED